MTNGTNMFCILKFFVLCEKPLDTGDSIH